MKTSQTKGWGIFYPAQWEGQHSGIVQRKHERARSKKFTSTFSWLAKADPENLDWGSAGHHDAFCQGKWRFQQSPLSVGAPTNHRRHGPSAPSPHRSAEGLAQPQFLKLLQVAVEFPIIVACCDQFYEFFNCCVAKDFTVPQKVTFFKCLPVQWRLCISSSCLLHILQPRPHALT